MLVRHKKPFIKGLVLLAAFWIMVFIMLMPIFPSSTGARVTSLGFADEVFNALSKGSSNFIAEVSQAIKAAAGREVELSATIEQPALAAAALRELEQAGISHASNINGVVSFHGNLGAVLEAAVSDAADLFHNDGAAVSARYGGIAPLDVSRAWWRLLDPCVGELQRHGRIQDANLVNMVLKKAIEPANNFYGISDAKVADNIVLMLAMLAFYVLYAIWYGFGIYNLFDGMGLIGGHAPKAADNKG